MKNLQHSRNNQQKIIASGLSGAFKTAPLGVGSAFISGAALTTTTVPNTILWGLITVGTSTTTAVVMPVVITYAVCGAVLGGLFAAYRTYNRQNEIEKKFIQYAMYDGEEK